MPQVGAQPGYGQYPPPYAGGFGRRAQLSRPGMATTAGVLGIIFGTVGFFTSAFLLIILTFSIEASALFGPGGTSDFAVFRFISASGIVLASLLVFIGAIQLLGGKTNKLIVWSCIIFGVAKVIEIPAVATNEAAGHRGGLNLLVISLLLAGMLVFFAKNREVEAWLARTRAADTPPSDHPPAARL